MNKKIIEDWIPNYYGDKRNIGPHVCLDAYEMEHMGFFKRLIDNEDSDSIFTFDGEYFENGIEANSDNGYDFYDSDSEILCNSADWFENVENINDSNSINDNEIQDYITKINDDINLDLINKNDPS